MLNSLIELDVILLEQFEDFFGIFQNEWTGIGNLFEFLLAGMAIAGLWLLDRGGYCCSVGIN